MTRQLLLQTLTLLNFSGVSAIENDTNDELYQDVTLFFPSLGYGHKEDKRVWQIQFCNSVYHWRRRGGNWTGTTLLIISNDVITVLLLYDLISWDMNQCCFLFMRFPYTHIAVISKCRHVLHCRHVNMRCVHVHEQTCIADVANKICWSGLRTFMSHLAFRKIVFFTKNVFVPIRIYMYMYAVWGWSTFQ